MCEVHPATHQDTLLALRWVKIWSSRDQYWSEHEAVHERSWRKPWDCMRHRNLCGSLVSGRSSTSWHPRSFQFPWLWTLQHSGGMGYVPWDHKRHGNEACCDEDDKREQLWGAGHGMLPEQFRGPAMCLTNMTQSWCFTFSRFHIALKRAVMSVNHLAYIITLCMSSLCEKQPFNILLIILLPSVLQKFHLWLRKLLSEIVICIGYSLDSCDPPRM